MSQRWRIAAAQYPLTRVTSRAAWAERLAGWVARGAATGAELLLFPEYASLELAALLPPATRAAPGAMWRALQAWHGEYLALHEALARAYRVQLVAGSFPVQVGAAVHNRVYWFAPTGLCGAQDKQIVTPFEAEHWHIRPGRGQHLWTTAAGMAGILVCYDAEFPLLARRLIENGAEWLLVPSCTDDWAGYHRVRIACQARALEGQCGVIQAVTWGNSSWLPGLATHRGRAGCFVPPDLDLPADGVLAVGGDAPGWVVAELPRTSLLRVRSAGAVRTVRDWPQSTSSGS